MTSERFFGETKKDNTSARSFTKKIAAALLVAFIMAALSGCAKENKYVNVGVEMSTAGLSLYLTNTVNGFQKISNYVFFANSAEEAMEKIRLDKQGIDITYLKAEDLGLIKADDPLKVVFPDCFGPDGGLKGVWVAKESWLNKAPNYSYRYILGMAQSADYRAAHMSMNYGDALKSLEGVRDVDWEKYPEVMQYCAVYALSNKEELSDTAFTVKDAGSMLSMFEGFDAGEEEGYELCRNAYEKYCTADSKPFGEMFDFSLAVKALNEAESASE